MSELSVRRRLYRQVRVAAAVTGLDQALAKHRSEADYIDRTIATVRNHRGADNCWPQWANIFADEIEDLRADLAAVSAELVSRGEQLEQVRRELRASESLAVRESAARLRLTQRAVQAEVRVAQLQQALDGALYIAEHPARPTTALESIASQLRAVLAGVEAAGTEGDRG